MIYLASPISHPDAAVRHERFRSACCVAASSIRASEQVFSPIAHGHSLIEYGLPTDWAFWYRFARKPLQRCDEVVVLTPEDWQESASAREEVRIAMALGKPVRYGPRAMSHIRRR